ncbi:MAG: hypothetical protein NT069_21790, partial [Planctomycetota bacterium]|nr:hypothetical protein [Planctomycetota bacterium]
MHRLILYPRNPTGQLPATRAVGRVLAELPNLVRDAVAGAMGPSRGITGRGPGWLARAADVRIEGIDRSAPDRPAFLLSAPPLGEAASDQFSQRTLFPELSPNRDDTGLDVLNNTLRSLFHPEMGHPPLSLGLMRRLLRLTNALAATSELKGFALDTPKRGGRPLSMVNSDLIEVVRMQLEERTETTLVEFIGSIDRLELDAGQFR